jgi:hypothetical protein
MTNRVLDSGCASNTSSRRPRWGETRYFEVSPPICLVPWTFVITIQRQGEQFQGAKVTRLQAIGLPLRCGRRMPAVHFRNGPASAPCPTTASASAARSRTSSAPAASAWRDTSTAADAVADTPGATTGRGTRGLRQLHHPKDRRRSDDDGGGGQQGTPRRSRQRVNPATEDKPANPAKEKHRRQGCGGRRNKSAHI